MQCLLCCAVLCSLATQLNDYTLTFKDDPAAVLSSAGALAVFTSTLQTQMAGFFDVNPQNVCHLTP